MLKIYLTIICLIFALTKSIAQPEKTLDMQLAKQYYDNEEYSKALPIYKKYYNDNQNDNTLFNQYLACLVGMKNFEEAHAILKKIIKKNPLQTNNYIVQAQLFESENKTAEADASYEKAIDQIKLKNIEQVNALAQTFVNLKMFDRAIATYEKGRKESGASNAYFFELGQLYQQKGDIAVMMNNYFEAIKAQPELLQSFKNNLQNLVEDENNYSIVQSMLFKKAQAEPENVLWAELLIWNYSQKKDFYSALIQAKALDKRLNEDGTRIFTIAKSAATEKDYETAIEAFEYVKDKGENNVLYIPAYTELLSTYKNKLLNSEYTESELLQLEKDYKTFLEYNNHRQGKASVIKDLAFLQARYLNNTDSAISHLLQIVNNPSIERKMQALCKLDLGDYYLLQDNIWDAYIYYAQVDKAFKDDPLGEEARFRLAKLSYFNGDFEWAQAQLTVLKASTSELIANDALDLSIFIQDNMATDTIYTALRMFSEAEMFLFQNKTSEALITLDSIETQFANHNINDDLLMLRAKTAYKQRRYEDAITHLNTIVKSYYDGILADDALMLLAQIYHNKLQNKEQAQQCYEKIILDKGDSVFSVEARKQYRLLRGDKLN